MRNFLKKTLALVLAAAMCLSFAGCYSENKTWSARMGDETLSIGGYIYYLTNAFSLAREEVSSDEEVLKATIDGVDGETWIKNKALNYLKSYFFVSKKFNDLGLTLSQEDLDAAKSYTDSYWPSLSSYMETLGVSKDSFYNAYAVYNTKYQTILETVYGEGGEMAVSDDELKSYYTENYCSYDYFYVSLKTTDDEGNSVYMDEAQKAETLEKANQYAAKINAGEVTIEDAAEQYAAEIDDESTYYSPSPAVKENITSTITDALETMKDGETKVVESSTGYYVLRKLSIEDKFAEAVEDEDQKTSIIFNMKKDDFADYVEKQADSFEGVEINNSAINAAKVAKLVSDDNKKGVKTESEAE